MNKIILFELNEVPLRIVDYYRQVRPQSWFARNYDKLKKYETISENQGHLSPWNTWPTVHRGVANDRHYISDFNQDLSAVDAEFPPIWHLLTQAGITTGVFGSLHSYPLPADHKNYEFYIPDVFAAGSECFPANIELFQSVNLRLSRESARNVDRAVPYGQMAKLMLKANDLGFTASTLFDVGGHLVQERLSSWKVTRRRTYQSVIAFDVFFKLLQTRRPDFVTFFTNHVASSLHRYWAALFPQDYETQKFDAEWIETYSNEIVFAMDKADRMLNRLASYINQRPEYKLLITSSMGQHAVECEPIETQLYVADKPAFMAMLGVIGREDFQELPSMLPQFNFSLSDARAKNVEACLAGLRVNGEPVAYRRLEGRGFSVDFGHPNLKETQISLDGKPISLAASGLENVVIEDKSSSTAYHIPEGHLFVYHPANQASDRAVHQMQTTEIAPAILSNFAAARPSYMPAANPKAI